MMATEHITRGEFGEWRREEAEFRQRLEERMARHHLELTAQINAMLALQRDQNGRVGRTESNVAVIQRELEAIKSEDSEIERLVASIQKDGCHQYRAHEKALELLEGSGAILPTDAARVRAFHLSDLSTRQKVAAGVGISALLIPAVGDLIRLMTQVVHWLETIHAQ